MTEGLRRLATALADLRRSAGGPSLRVMAHGTGISHTVLNDYFRGKRRPPLAKLWATVDHLGGDRETFDALWEAAAAPARTVAADLTGPGDVSLTYDPETGALYFTFDQELKVVRTVTLRPGLAVDVGPGGVLVGVEVIPP